MLRGLILLLLGVGATLLALPFVMTSRALESHGIAIAGRVAYKSETIKVLYSSWERSREATIEYTVPETRSVGFLTVYPDAPQYDALHTHQAVELRYLPRADVPTVPMAKALWEMHALPVVRLINFHEQSKLKSFFTPGVVLVCEVFGGAAVLLILWRITRSSLFAWTAGLAVLAGIGVAYLQDFPRPTPAPAVDLRRGSGTVKSIGQIDKLFSGAHERGVHAEQPVDVVGVEFIPEGRTEPVVAVDLIDHGSIPGLKEHSTIPIEYEDRAPRTAYITGATRKFPQRNASGTIIEGAVCVAVIIGFWAVWQGIAGAFRRLTAR